MKRRIALPPLSRWYAVSDLGRKTQQRVLMISIIVEMDTSISFHRTNLCACLCGAMCRSMIE